MKMIRGIPNIGNSCYAAALIQCLRACLSLYPRELSLLERYISGDKSQNIPSIWESIDGNQHDSHDFYMKFMERLPLAVSNHFMIEYSGGVKMSYLPITTEMENGGDHIVNVPDTVCIYRIPSEVRLSDFSSLEIDTTSSGKVITHRYRMKCCICYSHGRSGREALQWHGSNTLSKGVDHYYAIVEQDGDWYKCDDSYISRIQGTNEKYPVYMVFYCK